MEPCATCRFFRVEPAWPTSRKGFGECRLYPQTVPKESTDGCGQHAPKGGLRVVTRTSNDETT